MYVPASFRETNLAKLHEFIERHSFATLISQAGDEPVATHLPLLLGREAGSQGMLSGHMARANSHWKVAAAQPVLVLFQGPHAYISPNWYESIDVVPTWNYVTVHAYGTLRLMDDRSRLTELIHRMVERYESTSPKPWLLESQDEGFVSRMLDAVVGFDIEIQRIEGKWKLSQNHPPEHREKVVRHLRASDAFDSRQIADLMTFE